MISCACLLRDLELLPADAPDEIEEKGVNLSVGQKQRMSIARVLYHTHSLLFLFDNPQGYSHVRVAREIHERAFLNLLRGKTRVVVNNCYDFVSTCDRVMLMQPDVEAANGQYAVPTERVGGILLEYGRVRREGD